MPENKVGAIVIKSFALLVVLGLAQHAMAQQAMAQDAKTPYPKMAPIDQYLMADREAEIALARSAAPDSISRDATILVLGRQGYETAVQGKNGFVCMVGRAWGAAFDWAEFWNPKVRAARLYEPPGCTFDVAHRLPARQDGNGRSFQSGDRVGSQSGVRE